MPGKITELTDAGALTGDELVEVVDDPAGTPVSRKTTVAQIASLGTPHPQPYDGSTYGLGLPGFPLEGGAGTVGTNGDWTYYTPMILSQERTINQLIVNLNATSTGTAASLSIHSADANFNPTALVLDAGTIDISTTGIKTKTISQVLPAGRYVLRVQANGGGTYLCALYTPTWKDTMGSSDFIRAYVNTSGTYSATAPDPGLSINSFLLGNNAGYAFVLPRFTA